MNWNDNEPIYIQIKTQISSSIIEGSLLENEPIPSIRQVAADYNINPLTVAKAYGILADDGIVEKRRGLGMFVCTGAKSQLLKDQRILFIEQEWPEIIKKIKRLGLCMSELAE